MVKPSHLCLDTFLFDHDLGRIRLAHTLTYSLCTNSY